MSRGDMSLVSWDHLCAILFLCLSCVVICNLPSSGELGRFTMVFILNYTQGALQHPTSNWFNHSTANWLDIIISSHSFDSALTVQEM